MAPSSMALEAMRVRLFVAPIVKCFLKYIAWPAGIWLPAAGAGRLVVVRTGRRVGEVSPPVKPPGPESHAESLKLAAVQLRSLWQSVKYFQLSTALNIWVS